MVKASSQLGCQSCGVEYCQHCTLLWRDHVVNGKRATCDEVSASMFTLVCRRAFVFILECVHRSWRGDLRTMART